MKKRKLIRAFSLALLPVILLASCGKESGNSDAASDEVSSTTAPEITAEVTYPEYADVTPTEENSAVVMTDKTGLVPYAVRALGKNCVKPVLSGDRLLLCPFAPGTDTVTLYNSYSEKAIYEVTVDDGLSVKWTEKLPEAPKNSRTVGAKSGNITDELQRYIDELSASGGGTVYVPAGSYTLGTISVKDNVEIRFEGFVADVSQGYSDSVAALANSGEAAYIRSSGTQARSMFFVNVDLPQSYCTAGHDNFGIFGGFFDCQASRLFIGMSCAEHAVFENILIKDLPNNHAFQIQGCTDVTLSGLLFAGYNYPEKDPVLTRETIQLEPTTPGAIGSNYETNVIQCNAGDYHHNYGVKVTGCYFGKSDLYGSQLVALGHHSATGGLACDGLEFSYNTVDNPRYCGLHLLDMINVKIIGNTFVSVGKASGSSLGSDTALVSVYGLDKNQKYTDANGKSITFADSCELPGVRNAEIAGNRFELGEGTFLKAVFVNGINNSVSARYVSSTALRVENYGGLPYKTEGYILVTNLAYGITIGHNVFSIPTPTDNPGNFIYLKKASGLILEDNTCEFGEGVSFRHSDGAEGILRESVTDGDKRYRRMVSMSPVAQKTLTVVSEGTVIPVANPERELNVTFDTGGNGDIRLETDVSGNLRVIITPHGGYRLSGFTGPDGKPADMSQPPRAGTYVAVFSAG